MTVDRPQVEAHAPGVLVIRYEWAEQLEPSWQADLLAEAAAAAASGPVGLVFVLAERIRDIAPSIRVFWRTITGDRRYRIGAVAVVTRSWAVEVAASGFGVTNALSGAEVRVRTFRDEGAAADWAASVTRPAAVAASR